MSVDNGSSVLKSSNTQDEVRRAQKARQKRNARKSTLAPSEGYLDGMKKDDIRERGVKMIDILGVTMTSTGEICDTKLKKAAFIYVSEFSMSSVRLSWMDRHTKALAKALGSLDDRSLQGYAKWKLNDAFRKTWH